MALRYQRLWHVARSEGKDAWLDTKTGQEVRYLAGVNPNFLPNPNKPPAPKPPAPITKNAASPPAAPTPKSK